MPEGSIIHDLMTVIVDRKANPPERSYVASLLKGGLARIGPKITEEAAEVVEAAGEEGEPGRAHLVREVADLLFHTLVLLGERDVAWNEIEAELAHRFGVGGIVEKESRASATPLTRNP